MMTYPSALNDNLPIGSGVTEAACKTLVKQRLGGAGMRWTPRGAHVVLQLRAAAPTLNRWNAFWRKISLYGVMIEAHRTIIPPDPLHHLGITPAVGAAVRELWDDLQIVDDASDLTFLKKKPKTAERLARFSEDEVLAAIR